MSTCVSQGVFFGNDVVDLEAAGQSFADKRVLARVFSEAELAASPRRGAQRWLWLATLWAAKEAAYKAIKRQHPDISFAWRSFEVAVDLSCVSFAFQSGHLRLPLRIWLAEARGFVHALCCDASVQRSYVWLAQPGPQEPDAESRSVRHVLESGLRGLCGPGGEFSALCEAELYGGGEEPPELRDPAGQRQVPVSLSHDGRFVAAAVPVPATADYERAEDSGILAPMDVVELML